MKLVKHPILKGYVKANGLFFPHGLTSEDQAIKRLMEMWQPGCKIYRSHIGYILIWSRSRRVNCQQMPGASLVKHDDIHTSALLSDKELNSMDKVPDSVLIVHQGKIHNLPCSPDQLVNPASWIDISGYQTIDKISSLGAPPLPPKPKSAPVKKSLDSIFKKPLPKAVPEREAILSKFKEKEDAKKGKPMATSNRPSAFGWLGIFGALFAIKTSSSTQGNHTFADPEATVANKPSFLRYFFSSLIKATGLWIFFSNMQSRYFRKMIKMFENGDLENALRHAIPLSKTREMGPHLPAWLAPKPRSNLDISPQGAGGSVGYTFGPSVYDHINQLYEAAFKKLDREGRIEEAVFVLAELMQENERAVSYLEKKGRLIEAAELAESRELSPGLIIRQWFIAGKIERAVWIARKTHAFGKAVLMLEQSHPQLADTLRLLWAKFLAQAGKYEEAVTVIWKIQEARHLAEDWIERAIAFGGINGARILAHRVVLDPKKFSDTSNRLSAFVKDAEGSMAMARIEFANALIQQPQTPETKALGRLIFRPLLQDRMSLKNLWAKRRFEDLLSFMDDGVLKADFQKINFSEVTSESSSSTQRLEKRYPLKEVTFTDFGSAEIFDFCILPKGRFLVALGEAGASIINSKGKSIRHFNVPAHSLVVSDYHNRALALAPRGETYRISRILIDEQKAEFWHEANLDKWVDTFDGSLWFITNGNSLFAIDVQDKFFKSFWHVSDLPGIVSLPKRTKDSLAFIVSEEDHFQSLWRYDLPGFKLRHRGDIDGIQDKLILDMKVSAWGNVKAIHVQESADGFQTLSYLQTNQDKTVKEAQLDIPPGIIHAPAISEDWFAIPMEDENGMAIYLVDSTDPRARLCLRLSNAKRLKIRFIDDEMGVCDDQGRIIRIDLQSGATIQNILI